MNNSKVDHRDIELLKAHLLGKPRSWIVAHPEVRLSLWQKFKLWRMTRRRASGEPLAYILGRQEFFGLDFEVTPDVLIPRPDTEVLVERALDILKTQPKTVVEVGTGSGAIAISIAKNSSARVLATDISSAALRVALRNAKTLGANVEFHQDNLLASPTYFPTTEPVLVAMNLPYLSDEHWTEADAHVKTFEPTLALRAGTDGLDLYKTVFAQLSQFSNITHILCEAHDDQMEDLAELAKTNFPNCKTIFHKDLANHRRVLEVALP